MFLRRGGLRIAFFVSSPSRPSSLSLRIAVPAFACGFFSLREADVGMCPRQGSNFLLLRQKKVTKEKATRRWRSARGRLLCGARSLGPAPNSLRGLRPLRSDKRREVRLRSVLRTRPQSPALLDATHGAQEQCGRCFATSPVHLASHRARAKRRVTVRCEASRIWCSCPPSDELSSAGLCGARVSAHQ